MNLLRYAGYTIFTAAIAGALYLTHREFYIEGFKKGNSVGQQTAAREILENIDKELMYCKPVDNKVYKLPKFKRIATSSDCVIQEDLQLELRVDCGNGPLSIPLKKMTSKIGGTTIW